MPTIDVKIDKPRLAALRRDLKGIARGVEKVVVGAVNDTAKEVATSTKNPKSILKQITDKTTIKAGPLRKHLDAGLRRATKPRPSASITLSDSKRLVLRHFGAKQTARGVTYRINKGEPRTLVAGAFGPGTKQTKTRQARPQLFKGHVVKRIGKSKKPIRFLRGPSPWGVFMAAGGPAIAEADAAERLEKNLDQRLQFVLLKAQGKI